MWFESDVARRRILGDYRAMAKPAIDYSALTPDEKFDLIDELWQSLDPEDFALTPEQRVELERRLARLDQDGPNGIPWAKVRERMVTQDE